MEQELRCPDHLGERDSKCCIASEPRHVPAEVAIRPSSVIQYISTNPSLPRWSRRYWPSIKTTVSAVAWAPIQRNFSFSRVD